MKGRASSIGAVLLALTAVTALARFAPHARYQPPSPRPATGSLVTGLIHVHLPPDEASFRRLIRQARDAGHDFILFSSPGTFDAALDDREGYYTVRGESGGGVHRPPLLVLSGAEVATDRGNLLLAGVEPGTSFPLTLRSTVLVGAVRDAGGVALALRPCQAPRSPSSLSAPGIPDPPAGVAGSEALSLAADFTSPVYYRLALASLISMVNPDGALASLAPPSDPRRPESPVLAWTGPASPLAGFGIDPGPASGGGWRRTGAAIGWVATVVYLERPLARTPAAFAADRRLILDGLAAGRTAAVVPPLGDPGALSFQVAGDLWQASVRDQPGTWLVLRRDGAIIASGAGPALAARDAGDGGRRVDVYRRRSEVGLPGDGWALWMVSAPTEPAGGQGS